MILSRAVAKSLCRYFVDHYRNRRRPATLASGTKGARLDGKVDGTRSLKYSVGQGYSRGWRKLKCSVSCEIDLCEQVDVEKRPDAAQLLLWHH